MKTSRLLIITLSACLFAAACGGSGELSSGAWDSDQLCSFVDDTAVNAAAARDDLAGETIDWGNDDAGCKWGGPNNSAFNPDLVFWMQQSTETEPNAFNEGNQLNIPGADTSWVREAIGADDGGPFDASFNAYVGDQRLSIEPGIEYDTDGGLSDFALAKLTEWVAIQAAAE